jgi:hypothetical protein
MSYLLGSREGENGNGRKNKMLSDNKKKIIGCNQF